MNGKDNLLLLSEADPNLGESWFLLGILARCAPEDFRMAVLELRTMRIKAAEERTSGRAD